MMQNGDIGPRTIRWGLLVVHVGVDMEIVAFDVEILDVRQDEAGNDEYLIAPKAGRGLAWVRPWDVRTSS